MCFLIRSEGSGKEKESEFKSTLRNNDPLNPADWIGPQIELFNRHQTNVNSS